MTVDETMPIKTYLLPFGKQDVAYPNRGLAIEQAYLRCKKESLLQHLFVLWVGYSRGAVACAVQSPLWCFKLSTDLECCLTFPHPSSASASQTSLGMLVDIRMHAVNPLAVREEEKIEKKWVYRRTLYANILFRRLHINVLFCITKVFEV